MATAVGRTAVKTMTAHDDGLAASLEAIRQTPLDEISAEQADSVVRKIIRHESETQVVEVAAFSSSI